MDIGGADKIIKFFPSIRETYNFMGIPEVLYKYGYQDQASDT